MRNISAATTFFYPSFSIANIAASQAFEEGTYYPPFKMKFKILYKVRTLKEE
jgi:hypothetical protein